MPRPQNDVRIVLTLLAGFAVGIHVGVFLHELGHALGIWLSGGQVTSFVILAPLPAGSVHPAVSSSHSATMQWWGGVAFGSLFTLLPLALARYLASGALLRYVALMVAACSFAHNGFYLFVGSLVPFADAAQMIRLGAPRWLLFLLGVPLVVGFVAVLTSALRVVGLKPEDASWRWVALGETGLLPIPALMVIGTVLSPREYETMKLAILVLGVSYLACFLTAAVWAHRAARGQDRDLGSPPMLQTWVDTWKLIGWTVLVIAVEWLAFRPA